MNSDREQSGWNWPVTGVAVLIALGIGFIGARLTATTPEPAPAPVLAAPEVAAVPPSNSLSLKASDLATMGIVVEPVAQGNLSAEVLAPATVTPAPNGEAVVTAHSGGTVLRLDKRLGDRVTLGEVLALVESREAVAMIAGREVAETKAALARSVAAREKELYDQRVTPRQDLERAEAEVEVAEAEVRRARMTAEAAHVTPDGKAVTVLSPLTGIVTAIASQVGAFVQPDTELFRLSDPRFVQIEVSVTAMDAQRIAIGDKAIIVTPTGASLAASVRSVTPTVNALTRSGTVILSLTSSTERLAPGEIVRTRITPRTAIPAGIVVPDEAIQNVGGRDVVFVRTQDGFKIQPVIAGFRSGGQVSIVSGLEAGQAIATRNAFFLKAAFVINAQGEE